MNWHNELMWQRSEALRKMQDTYVTNMNEGLYLLRSNLDYLDNRYVDINQLLGARSDGDNLIVITEENGKERILAREFLMVTDDINYDDKLKL